MQIKTGIRAKEVVAWVTSASESSGIDEIMKLTSLYEMLGWMPTSSDPRLTKEGMEARHTSNEVYKQES